MPVLLKNGGACRFAQFQSLGNLFLISSLQLFVVQLKIPHGRLAGDLEFYKQSSSPLSFCYVDVHTSPFSVTWVDRRESVGAGLVITRSVETNGSMPFRFHCHCYWFSLV